MQFFLAELRRFIYRRTLWVTIGCAIVLGCFILYRGRSGVAGLRVWWFVYQTSLEPYRLMLPLLVSIVVGSSLVDDRATGFVRYVFYRGVSRTHYLFTKFGAGAIGAALVAGAPLFVFGLFIQQVGNPTNDRPGALPLPPAFPQSDAAVILWYTLSAMLGGVFFFSVGTLAAVVTKNRYIVSATPFILHLLLLVALPIDLRWLGPSGLLDLQNQQLEPGFVLLYWLAWISTFVVAALVLVRRQERID